MAATEVALAVPAPAGGALILAAALALPGVQPQARAESAPDNGMFGLRHLAYRDRQSGLERIAVRAPSLVFLVPIAGEWTVEGGTGRENVSGATPRYHTAVTGASRMQDRRRAGDLRVTRYLPSGTLSVGTAYSAENDYRSRALSLQASVSSEDRNTTWAMGIGGSRDKINPVNFLVIDEKKRTTDLLLGVTQVLSARDIVQANIAYSAGRGYFSDPYKIFDSRPRERNQTALTLKWNRHFEGSNATSRLSYRYASDSYQVRSHTFSGEYVQPMPAGWTLAPSARYYAQSAAQFYADPNYHPVLGAPFLAGLLPGSRPYLSMDQRLSSFGAITVGLRIAKQFGPHWSVEFKFERYEQRGGWQLFERGSPGLEPLIARWVQVGVYRTW